LILNFGGIWVLISLDVYAGCRNFRGVFDVLFDIWIEFVVWNFSRLNCCSKIWVDFVGCWPNGGVIDGVLACFGFG
jgi:hypothetical protein